MLDRIDLQKAFAVSRRSSFERLEIYAETTSCSDILIEGAKEQLRRSHTSGLSVRGVQEGKQIHRTSTHLSNETARQLIENEPAVPQFCEDLTRGAEPHAYKHLFAKIRKLTSPQVSLERFLLKDRLTHFEVCNEGQVQAGHQELSVVELHWRFHQLPGAPLKVDCYSKTNRKD